jgi:hypothetical protein
LLAGSRRLKEMMLSLRRVPVSMTPCTRQGMQGPSSDTETDAR